ncbi:hypothetical protein AFAE65S_02826 [Alcaligenes phenolicus]
MTVSSEQSRVQCATDGVATSFPVPFGFLQNRGLRVTLVGSEGNEQELSLNAGWFSSFQRATQKIQHRHQMLLLRQTE